MKKFKVELSSLGITSKTVNYNDYQWTLTHGQIIKESALTKNFPQFFVEYNETPKEEEVVVSETKEEVTVPETKEEVTVPETKEEVTETKEPETKEEVTETKESETKEEVTETKEETTVDPIETAKGFKTKVELAEFAKEMGVELSTNNSLKNMVKEFETAIKG